MTAQSHPARTPSRAGRRRFWQRMTFISALALTLWVLAYFLPAPSTASVNGQISYSTAWEFGNAQALDDGTWQITSNLGYRVLLTDGWIVNRAVTSAECPHRHSLLSWMIESLLPQSVQAGHGTDQDLARVYAAFAESLTTPSPHEWGTASPNEPTYCQGHYLVAIADENTADAPPALLGNSILLKANIFPPNSDTAIPFSFTTHEAWGALHDMTTPDGTPVHLAIGTQAASLTVIRRLDTLFDDIDFNAYPAGTLSDTDLARALLRNLTGDTQVMVTEGKTHVRQ
ncbi:MAG: hypothetical protein ACOYL5_20115 [Phototrophicaceae bacterium]